MDIGCLLAQILWIYSLILIARIILSWVMMFRSPPSALSGVVKVIYDLTEPILGFFRRYIPPIGGLDLSPIFIFIILSIIQGAIC